MAEKHLNTALALAQNDAPNSIIDIVNVIGMMYFDKGEYLPAINQYEKVKKMAIQDSIPEMLGIALHNIAESQYHLSNLNLASEFATKALHQRIADQDADWIVSTLVLRTNIALQENRAEHDIRELWSSLDSLPVDKINPHLIEALSLITSIMSKDQYSAIFSKQEVIGIANKLERQNALLFELKNNLEQVRNQYALQGVVESFKLEEEKVRISESKANLQYVFGSSIGVILLLAIGALYFHRKKKRKNEVQLFRLDEEHKKTYMSYELILKEYADLKLSSKNKDESLAAANEQMILMNSKMREMNELHCALLLVARQKGPLPPKNLPKRHLYLHRRKKE